MRAAREEFIARFERQTPPLTRAGKRGDRLANGHHLHFLLIGVVTLEQMLRPVKQTQAQI